MMPPDNHKRQLRTVSTWKQVGLLTLTISIFFLFAVAVCSTRTSTVANLGIDGTDKKIIDGIRAAIPSPTNEDTVLPITSLDGQASQSISLNSSSSGVSRAYLVALANDAGVRLKTIVTR